MLPHQIICTALNLLKDQPQGLVAAKQIVALDEFYLLADAIVCTVLNLLKDQPQALKVGVFYSFQEVDSVPKEDHDLCLDRIVTA